MTWIGQTNHRRTKFSILHYAKGWNEDLWPGQSLEKAVDNIDVKSWSLEVQLGDPWLSSPWLEVITAKPEVTQWCKLQSSTRSFQEKNKGKGEATRKVQTTGAWRIPKEQNLRPPKRCGKGILIILGGCFLAAIQVWICRRKQKYSEYPTGRTETTLL